MSSTHPDYPSRIILRWTLSNPTAISAAVLEGLPIVPGDAATKGKIAVAKLLSRLRPTFSLPFSKDRSGLSRDPQIAIQFDADPLTHNKVTVRWGTEILAAIERVKATPHRIEVPLMVIHGEADSLNLADGVRSWFPKLGSSTKELKVFSRSLHEVHNDFENKQMMTDVTTFLKSL